MVVLSQRKRLYGVPCFKGTLLIIEHALAKNGREIGPKHCVFCNPSEFVDPF